LKEQLYKQKLRRKCIILKECLLTIPKTFNENNQCIFKIKDVEEVIDESL
jgi:hypothetical protein